MEATTSAEALRRQRAAQGGSATTRAATTLNAEQASLRKYCQPALAAETGSQVAAGGPFDTCCRIPRRLPPAGFQRRGEFTADVCSLACQEQCQTEFTLRSAYHVLGVRGAVGARRFG